MGLSSVEQNFMLQSPAYIAELIANSYPGYRVNNVIPFAGNSRPDNNNITIRDGVVSFYIGYHTLWQGFIDDYDTFIIGGARMINDGLGRNSGVIYKDNNYADPNAVQQKFYSWYGIVSYLNFPQNANYMYSWNFIGWKVDCDFQSPLTPGLPITFSFRNADGDNPFTDDNRLTTTTPQRVTSTSVSGFVAAGYIGTVRVGFTFRALKLGGATFATITISKQRLVSTLLVLRRLARIGYMREQLSKAARSCLLRNCSKLQSGRVLPLLFVAIRIFQRIRQNLTIHHLWL